MPAIMFFFFQFTQTKTFRGLYDNAPATHVHTKNRFKFDSDTAFDAPPLILDSNLEAPFAV